jgi:8-oxo-dGTP diphosphatase
LQWGYYFYSMAFKDELLNHFKTGHQLFLRNVSVDCIIFGFHGNELKVLLLQTKYSGNWALPGGFIFKEEHLDDAAKRILQHRTGLDDIFLQQFQVFSEPGRSTKKINKQFLKNSGVELEDSWMFDRFITVAYTALVDFSKASPVPDSFSSDCKWFNIHEIPALILDHRNILDKALENLRMQLNYHPVGYNLLPVKFTMPELQKLYETILDRKLDRRNFQRKITGTGILKRLNEIKKGVAHKAPYLYKFDLRKYQKALKGGMGFDL